MKRICILVLIAIIYQYASGQDYEFVVQHEGSSNAIGCFENYTYFNSGGNIHVLETGADNEFILVNSFRPGYTNYSDITIDSGKMYVAVWSAGVLIYDLADPVNPELLGATSGGFGPRGSIISDTILIATANEYASLHNIANPNQPEYLTSIEYEINRNITYALNKDVLYGFMQSGFSGPQYLLGYNISDPENPYYSVILQIYHNCGGPWPDCMETYDDKLFVAYNDTLKIYDISDADTIAYQTRFSVPGEINNMKIENDTIYLSVADTGVFIFNVSNIFEPELIAVYNQTALCNKLKIHDDYILSGLGTNGIKIADKSDLQNITDVYDYTQTDAVYSVHTINNLAYFSMMEAGLQIVDLSDVEQPVDLGHVDLPPYLKYIKSIPGFLYCAKQNDSLMHIISISDSLNPQKVGEIPAKHRWITDYYINQNRLFILDSTAYIKMYDLAVPESPALIAGFQESGRNIAVCDSLMVLSESFGDYPSQYKLKLFTIGNNNNLLFQDEIVLGIYKQYGSLQIEIEYPFIYYRSRAGLIVFEIIDNNSLTVCDEIIWPDGYSYSYDMVFDDSYIYLTGAFSNQGLTNIIEKFDPYNLTIYQSIDKMYYSLALRDSYFIGAARNGGYYIYGDAVVGFEDILPEEDKFKLCCYPNPCRQFTTIRFSIPENKKSELEIYNLSGQKMIGFDVSGRSQFVLETTGFSPGIYFYKLSTNGQSVIKKLIVTR